MAGLDPRRSSRARTTQAPSNVSSTSSSVSGRADRNTRSFHKGTSPQKSSTTDSLSSEPPEDSIVAEDPLAIRRSTRAGDTERTKALTKPESVGMGSVDDIEEEDEAVRCICGFDDYPGPPPLDEDTRRRSSKEGLEIDPIFEADVTDDAAGFFVQCDICKVWQHGACVGIMTEEASPDEYFCEECRKDLHKISTASNGQKYSHYLPLRQATVSSRSTSVTKDARQSPPRERETRNGRSASATQTSKRRSTMNSQRYDEEEALRRAIEASKEDATGEPLAENALRRPKRGRSDSEEKADTKRQRTSSRSLSPFDKGEDSDDAAATRNGGLKLKSRVPTAVRNHRSSEREERERLRAEQASRRKGRAERRRADDSDPSEELPLAARSTIQKAPVISASVVAVTENGTTNTVQPGPQEVPPSSQPTPDTPPSAAPSGSTTKVDKKRSHKKKGRNQYTRDRDDEASPARSQSRDIKDEQSGRHGEGGSKSHAKSKGGMGSRVTITDMKRRATALLNFITQTQMELAAEDGPEMDERKPKESPASSEKAPEKASERSTAKKLVEASEHNGDSGGPSNLGTAFKDLSCMEMMDRLTTRLVKWQQEYGA